MLGFGCYICDPLDTCCFYLLYSEKRIVNQISRQRQLQLLCRQPGAPAAKESFSTISDMILLPCHIVKSGFHCSYNSCMDI